MMRNDQEHQGPHLKQRIHQISPPASCNVLLQLCPSINADNIMGVDLASEFRHALQLLFCLFHK